MQNNIEYISKNMAKIYKTTPNTYGACLHDDCPMAASCLRKMVCQKFYETMEFIRIVNPTMCSKNENCKFYRSSTPVRFALGFKNFQYRMFPQQYETFKTRLMMRYGRNGFYLRRRGEVPLSPSEQEFVLKVLRKAGVTSDFSFDAYKEEILWYD